MVYENGTMAAAARAVASVVAHRRTSMARRRLLARNPSKNLRSPFLSLPPFAAAAAVSLLLSLSEFRAVGRSQNPGRGASNNVVGII